MQEPTIVFDFVNNVVRKVDNASSEREVILASTDEVQTSTGLTPTPA